MTDIRIFIDGEYVIQSFRRIKNKPKNLNITKDNFDWTEFIKSIVLKERNSCEAAKVTVNYYTARMIKSINKNSYDKQTAYLQKLETILQPFSVNIRLGTMSKSRIKKGETWTDDSHKRNEENKYTLVQKGIDTKIVWDLCDYYHTATPDDENVAVLIAGDGDFAEAIAKLKEKNICTEVIAFERHAGLSKELHEAADKVTLLNYQQIIDNGLIMS